MYRPSCGTKEGAVFWLNMDPCGIICAMLTWGLIGYAQYTVTVCVISPWMKDSLAAILNVLVFNALSILAIMAHFKAMLTDPGAVSSRAEPPAAELETGGGGTGGGVQGGCLANNPRRFCRKCNAYKPVRAHHCSICRRCIVKMDHHCPWVNNCVGISNHKFFIQFIGYVSLMSAYALVLVAGRFMACVHDSEGCGDPTVNMLVVFLVVESLLFGMFTMCMAMDQWEVVSTNQTQIDRLKGEVHQAPTIEINEVFGGGGRRFRLDWLLPTKVVFPADVWEEVMGYRCCRSREEEDDEGVELAAKATPSTDVLLRSSTDSGSGGSAGDVGSVRERKPAEMQRLLGDGGGISLKSSGLSGHHSPTGLGSVSAAGVGTAGGSGNNSMVSKDQMRFEL